MSHKIINVEPDEWKVTKKIRPDGKETETWVDKKRRISVYVHYRRIIVRGLKGSNYWTLEFNGRHIGPCRQVSPSGVGIWVDLHIDVLRKLLPDSDAEPEKVEPREKKAGPLPDPWGPTYVKSQAEPVDPDFDPEVLKLFHGGHAVGKCDGWYQRGPIPVNLVALTSPGGFTLAWDWDVESTPGQRGDAYVTLVNGVKPTWTNIWWRPTALRGSGRPWVSPCEKSCSVVDGSDGVLVKVNGIDCPAGEPVDIFVNGLQYGKRLRPSEVVTAVVGEAPPPRPGYSMGLSIQRWATHPVMVPPISVEEYEELKGGADDDAVTGTLKTRVMRQCKRMNTNEARNLCRTALPGFDFLTDNSGYFNALPLELWDEIIELTDTDRLNYDPQWFTCADFCTDFKSEAARLGAKVIVIWDFAGRHAYCALPVLKDDGSTELMFFEPQTDETPTMDPLKGSYRGTSGGIIMAW